MGGKGLGGSNHEVRHDSSTVLVSRAQLLVEVSAGGSAAVLLDKFLLHSPSRRAVKLLPLSAAVHLQKSGVFWQPRLRSHSLRPDLAGNPQTHS